MLYNYVSLQEWLLQAWCRWLYLVGDKVEWLGGRDQGMSPESSGREYTLPAEDPRLSPWHLI